MSAYSLGTFLIALYEIVSSGDWVFVTSLSNEAWRGLQCRPASQLMTITNAVFIASKVIEWLDTAFIVWLKNDNARAILAEAKGKPLVVSSPIAKATPRTSGGDSDISFLHAYHHASTLLAFLLVTSLDGAIKTGPLLNGFVHFLMYAHFARPAPRALVPFITIAQILQFWFVIYLWIAAGATCPSFAQFKADHPLEFATPFLFTPVFLFFFLRYFWRRWVAPKPPKAQQKEE
jgi:hypothetical protein